jgi:hypothetical protein
LAHSAKFTLTVQSASPNLALSTLFVRSFAKFFRGPWQGPLPPRCSNGKAACTLDFSNLPLEDRLKSVVVLAPQDVPSLTMETFHLTDGIGTCNADGSFSLTGASGIADGPFPGTVRVIEGGVGGSGGPFGLGTHDYYAWYSIESPGFVNTQVNDITGLIRGTLFGKCTITLGLGAGHYDARYTFFGGSRADEGSVATTTSVSPIGSPILDMTLTAATGLPGGASLPLPTPVCPPGGCT